MNKEEAIRELKIQFVGEYDRQREAKEMAIKALEQDNVLDKVRAEIEALPKTYPFINHFDTYVKEDDVRRIIDKHKAEREDKE
jgi:hypothetical protein